LAALQQRHRLFARWGDGRFETAFGESFVDDNLNWRSITRITGRSSKRNSHDYPARYITQELTGLLILGLVLSFLPFLVSLGGRGIWKFLSFLCCLLAAAGAVPTFGLSVVFWIAGWIFAGVAISNRRREDHLDRIEKALTDRASSSAAIAASPVEMLIANAGQLKAALQGG
jgi:hypothetical protein